jgi:hypothetical protein
MKDNLKKDGCIKNMKLVVTSEEHRGEAGILCANCGKNLSLLCASDSSDSGEVERLFREFGAIPVPNFGWFCCQKFGDEYSKEFGISFQRNKDGQIAYYNDEPFG